MRWLIKNLYYGHRIGDPLVCADHPDRRAVATFHGDFMCRQCATALADSKWGSHLLRLPYTRSKTITKTLWERGKGAGKPLHSTQRVHEREAA